MNAPAGQFLRFAAVGVLNTAIQYVVFVGLFRLAGVPMLLASAIGYAAGVVNSYFVNRRWTFRAGGRARWGEFARFVGVNLVAMGTNLVVLEASVTRLGLLPELGQVVAVGAALVVNFAGNRLWTFRSAGAGDGA